jgi:hypothetical protein
MTGVKSPVCYVIGIIVKVNAVRIFEFCEAAESAGRKPGARKVEREQTPPDAARRKLSGEIMDSKEFTGRPVPLRQ